MKRVNSNAISKLQGNSSSFVKHNSSIKNSITKVRGLSAALAVLVMVSTPLQASAHPHYQDNNRSSYTHQHNRNCDNYSYVPYNPDWGVKEATYVLTVSVNRNNTGIVKISDAQQVVLDAIYDCIGKRKVVNTEYDYVIFDVNYIEESDSYFIDPESFRFYKKDIRNLGRLHNKEVHIKGDLFMSPEGQQWVDEHNYMEYVEDKHITYQCSDGTHKYSYIDFKDREIFLGNYHSTNTEQKKSIMEISHIEREKDGTIWRNETLLKEYINWLKDPSYNYIDGCYYGTYGTYISFEAYMTDNNIKYFQDQGLKRSEQFINDEGFLIFISEEMKELYESKGYQYRR